MRCLLSAGGCRCRFGCVFLCGGVLCQFGTGSGVFGKDAPRGRLRSGQWSDEEVGYG
jgi:hypothetical protein